MAPVVIAVAMVIVILIAAVGYYFVVISPSGSTTASTSQPNHSSVSSSSSASLSKSTLSTSKISTSTISTSTTLSGVHTYRAVYNFSLGLGPSGVRVLPNETVQQYTSVQVASGTFTFSINPQNYSGTGSGHGTLTVTTTGFCSGSVTLSYDFPVQATNILGGNITFFVGLARPGNFSVPLTCTGPMEGVSTATNDPATFLATYPNELGVPSIPFTVNEHLQGNISYYFSVTQTS